MLSKLYNTKEIFLYIEESNSKNYNNNIEWFDFNKVVNNKPTKIFRLKRYFEID